MTIFFIIFAFENAMLLTLGNSNTFDCSRLIATLHLENARCGKRANITKGIGLKE